MGRRLLESIGGVGRFISSGPSHKVLSKLNLTSLDKDKSNKSTDFCWYRHTCSGPTCVGGRGGTQQLSGAAYGVSNWVEQHSWRTPVQDVASGNQSHNPEHS